MLRRQNRPPGGAFFRCGDGFGVLFLELEVVRGVEVFRGDGVVRVLFGMAAAYQDVRIQRGSPVVGASIDLIFHGFPSGGLHYTEYLVEHFL